MRAIRAKLATGAAICGVPCDDAPSVLLRLVESGESTRSSAAVDLISGPAATSTGARDGVPELTLGSES